MSTPSNLSEQILALPDGAGAVRSAGQTFDVRPYSGTGGYAIPLETKPGHAGLAPALALTYSTHAGDGIAGVGWTLSGAALERRTDRGLPAFDDHADTFTLERDELLPVGGGYYRLRIESSFKRVRHVRLSGQNFWVVTARDGGRTLYGSEPDHRLHDGAERISAWYASKQQDANGNEVTYAYLRDGATRDVRLASIGWGSCYRASFTYEQRPDPIRSFRPGFEHLQLHRLAGVDLQVSAGAGAAFHTYQTYTLSYTQSALTGRSLLTEVGVTGIGPDGSRRDLPPVGLGYAQPDPARRSWRSLSGALPGASLRDRNVTLVRQSGSGLPDVLETTATGHWLRENLGQGRFGSPRRVTAPGQVLLEHAGAFVSDMSGDGWGDLVVDGGARVYRGLPGGGWGAPYASAESPALDLEAPDVRVVDLNGDGMPDALRAGAGSWVCFENLGQGRWAPGVAVLRPPSLRLDDPRVHLTDINGDGLPDLVYVERRRIRVWPGEGWGRFGAPYELGHPPDLGADFDPRAVRWADLTGSGQADLLYVRNGAVVVCLNQAATGLSDALALATPPQSAQGHVEPVDLTGTGAAGLLLTDRQERPGAWRYLELFPAGKPDLLTHIRNGLGATTTIAYASSAAYWEADRRAGKPWRTAMPGPQVVVASVTIDDAVTGNRLGVRYTYHHGVYDGAEREFRGFALVEQTDREADPDDPAPLARVAVRRWYHTGSDVELRDTYTALPEGALADQVPALPWARRSLRGRLRREETFALDGDPRPYMVQQTAYRVFPVAVSPGTQRHSFAPLPVKSRSTSLERSAERRIVETTTTYDRHAGQGYGLPVEVRERAYGRSGAFTSPHERAQTQDLERYTVTRYANHDQPDGDYAGAYAPHYLVGLPAQVERYGVTGSGAVLLDRTRSFYDGEPYKGVGYPGTSTATAVVRGRLSCRLVLATTDQRLTATYPAGSGARTRFEAHGGYLTDGTEHYLHAERYRYDDRGMVVGALDPRGNESRFEYDSAQGLFPVSTIDAAGHPSRLIRGELPFQVAAVLDANGNTTGYTYDPCGLPSSKSVQGKRNGTEWTGDPPAAPTEAYAYDLSSVPIRILIRTRQVRLGATLDVVRYVDGLGRTVQERHSAEPDGAPPGAGRRFRVSGWQVFNHKGLPVKAYLPYFSASAEYAAGETGAAFVEMGHDPLGRVTRVAYPDGTFESTTYHPWLRSWSDRNDNSGHITPADVRYGRIATSLTRHARTPARSFVDALGRVIAVAEDNGSEEHVTRTVLDLKDQVTAVFDGRGLPRATWAFAYDDAGRTIRTEHRTALGERYALADAAGNPIWTRDARGVEVTRAFDALNRPLTESSQDGAGVKLRRRWRYVPYDERAPDFAVHQSRNLFGPPEEERDADGLRVFEYDWRNLVTSVSHRFWSQRDAAGRGWDEPDAQLWTDGPSWDPATPATERERLPSFLELPGLSDATALTVATRYDAAGRPTEVLYPEGMASRSTYNAAGFLETLSVDRGTGEGYQAVVAARAYNARGQLTRVRSGNGVETVRAYDEELDRLTRLVTMRTGTSTTHFQDLEYAYDPVGNPTRITDHLASSAFVPDQIIPNTRTFAYDPRYRLVEATGTRHRTARRKDADVLVPSPDPADYEPYAVRYDYDAVGNVTRNQEYSAGPLRYKDGRVDLFNGDRPEAEGSGDPGRGHFRYDANGNTTHTPRHEALAYTHDDQVRYVRLNEGAAVRYFRHGDRRVVRMAQTGDGPGLRLYVGNLEYHLRRGTSGFAKLVLHLEGQGRHAQMERVLDGADAASLELFHRHPDHLGSGHVLTKRDGDLLSQEESFAFGRASDRRDARNRYRYIGVEQDEDTGLCMTGPRTYDPVSGRFLQGDPIAGQGSGGESPYAYSGGNPVARADPSGYQDVGGTGTELDFDDPGGPQLPVAAPPAPQVPTVTTGGGKIIYSSPAGPTFSFEPKSPVLFTDSELEVTTPVGTFGVGYGGLSIPRPIQTGGMMGTLGFGVAWLHRASVLYEASASTTGLSALTESAYLRASWAARSGGQVFMRARLAMLLAQPAAGAATTGGGVAGGSSLAAGLGMGARFGAWGVAFTLGGAGGAAAGDKIGDMTGQAMIEHYGARDALSVYRHYVQNYGTYGGGVILAWKMGTGSYSVPEGVLQP